MGTTHEHADGIDCEGVPLAPDESCDVEPRADKCTRCGCSTFSRLCSVCARRARSWSTGSAPRGWVDA